MSGKGEFHSTPDADPSDPHVGRAPVCLRVLSYLYIVLGGLSLLDFLGNLLGGGPNCNLGFVYIPIGIGLLRRSRICRSLAMALLLLGFIAMTIWVVLLVGMRLPLHLWYAWGGTVRSVSLPWTYGLVLALLLVLFLFWQFRVLTNAKVKDLFGVKV